MRRAARIISTLAIMVVAIVGPWPGVATLAGTAAIEVPAGRIWY